MRKGIYLLRKLLQALATIIVVVILHFFLFRVMPGDPVSILVRNPKMTPEALDVIRQQFGLDQPLYVQFFVYLRDLMHFDLGSSFNYRQPVLEIIMERLPATLLLIGASTVMSVFIGILIGIIAAWKRGSKTDLSLLSMSLFLYSMPSFWFSIIMVMFFCVYLGWFPTSGMRTPGAVFLNNWEYWGNLLRHLFLPATTFAIGLAGEYAILMRSSLLDVFTEDYMLTARAKGVSDRRLLTMHALPNAMLPMITLIAINLGFVIAGEIQVETVFSWPGLGRLMYTALMARDYPLLQGLFLFVTICVILANYVTDILYSYLDPRVKN